MRARDRLRKLELQINPPTKRPRIVVISHGAPEPKRVAGQVIVRMLPGDEAL